MCAPYRSVFSFGIPKSQGHNHCVLRSHPTESTFHVIVPNMFPTRSSTPQSFWVADGPCITTLRALGQLVLDKVNHPRTTNCMWSLGLHFAKCIINYIYCKSWILDISWLLASWATYLSVKKWWKETTATIYTVLSRLTYNSAWDCHSEINWNWDI